MHFVTGNLPSNSSSGTLRQTHDYTGACDRIWPVPRETYSEKLVLVTDVSNRVLMRSGQAKRDSERGAIGNTSPLHTLIVDAIADLGPQGGNHEPDHTIELREFCHEHEHRIQPRLAHGDSPLGCDAAHLRRVQGGSANHQRVRERRQTNDHGQYA